MRSSRNGCSVIAEVLPLAATAWPALLTLAVTIIVLVILVLDAAPADLTMLGAVVVLAATGILKPGEAVSGFANEAVLTVGALFVVASAVRNTGALSYVYRLMAPATGDIPRSILRTMVPASLLSSVLNNTPIVAILTPVTRDAGRAAGIPASKLLIPLAYATTLGGLITLIGTSTNLVVSGLLVEHGHRGLRMFDLTWIGLPAAAAGIVYFVLIGHRLLPDRVSDTPFDRNGVRAYHFELRIPPDSPLDGETVEQAGLRALQGAFLAHIHREGELISMIEPDQLLRSGDVLAFVGNPSHVDVLLREKGLARAVEQPNPLEERSLQLFEAVVAHDSTLVGRSLREVGFRQRFQGIVLGIRRHGEPLSAALGRAPIHAGDLLLVEARSAFEAAASTSGEFSLVAPLERTGLRIPSKAPLVLAVILTMTVMMATSVIAVPIAAFAAAVALVLFGALPAHDARRSIDLSVLVTIAASFGLARAIETTGLAASAAGLIIRPLEAWGPVAVLAAIYLVTNALSEVLSNNAAAALVFPIAAAAATRMGADVMPFAIAVTVAASAAFASPLGYQTYLMIMGPGSYRFRDFVRAGLPLNIIIMMIAIPIIVAIWL